MRLRSGDKHHPRKSADRKAQIRKASEELRIYCIANQKILFSSIAVVVYLVFYFGWPNRPSVVFFQGPLGKRDKHVEKTQGYEKSGQR